MKNASMLGKFVFLLGDDVGDMWGRVVGFCGDFVEVALLNNKDDVSIFLPEELEVSEELKKMVM